MDSASHLSNLSDKVNFFFPPKDINVTVWDSSNLLPFCFSSLAEQISRSLTHHFFSIQYSVLWGCSAAVDWPRNHNLGLLSLCILKE